MDEVWLDTNGQLWLVNALDYEMTWKDKTARDRNTPITLNGYRSAQERLIQSRATHLDQLDRQAAEKKGASHRLQAAGRRGNRFASTWRISA